MSVLRVMQECYPLKRTLNDKPAQLQSTHIGVDEGLGYLIES
jgi:hypothetical protein